MKIKISSKFKIDFLTLTLFIMFLAQFLEQTIGLPSVVYFLIDIPIVYMFVKRFNRIVNLIGKKNMRFFIALLYLMLLINILSTVIGYVSITNTLYGMYKYYRGFVFFLCCLVYINEKSCQNTIKLIEVVFILNALFSLMQFIGGIKQDFLGGFFGTTLGVNMYTILFFVYVSIYVICSLLSKKMSTRLGVLYLGTMFLISALAEIKFYFVIFLILCFVLFLFERKTFRTLYLVIIILIGSIAGYNLLLVLFPEFSTLLSVIIEGGVEKFISLQSHYSTDADIGRTVIFEYSNNYFLVDEIQRWFGLGIGNITSSSLVDNSFYLLNAHTHYDGFYTAYLYIEQGALGFGLYVGFFVYLVYKAVFYLRRKTNLFYAKMLIMCAIGTLLLFWYNMSLASQFSFFMYWFHAYAYVNMVKDNEE